jgi:hypothetical protein
VVELTDRDCYYLFLELPDGQLLMQTMRECLEAENSIEDLLRRLNWPTEPQTPTSNALDKLLPSALQHIQKEIAPV